MKFKEFESGLSGVKMIIRDKTWIKFGSDPGLSPGFNPDFW